VDEVMEAGAELDERQVDALGVELVVEAVERVGRGDVDVGDGLALQHHPRRLAFLDELAQLGDEEAGVGEEQRGLPAEHDDVGALGEAVDAWVAVPTLAAGYPSEHDAVRPPVPMEEEQDRQHDGDDDALEDSLTGAQWVLVIALSLVSPAVNAIDKAIQLHRLDHAPQVPSRQLVRPIAA
jgi:hypothetical protein